MSNRVHDRKDGRQADWQQMTKAERRAAAKAAKARAAAVAKFRRWAGIAAGGLVVAIIAAFVVYRVVAGWNDGGATSSAAGSDGTTPTAAASDTAFPPLPAGADPALGSKPTTSAGTGDLTALKVTPLIQGTGPAAASGQQITVNYVGVSYKTGEEFDSSWTNSQPYTFALGAGSVIPGWDQGLVGVKVGSRVQLDIPSHLAYGDNPSGGRPAGPLRFIVDVLAVR
jgi:peptidylprolyl isomerase